MKVIELGGKQIILTDEQERALKSIGQLLVNYLLISGKGLLVTPENKHYAEIMKLVKP
jgi:hypothetical protein